MGFRREHLQPQNDAIETSTVEKEGNEPPFSRHGRERDSRIRTHKGDEMMTTFRMKAGLKAGSASIALGLALIATPSFAQTSGTDTAATQADTTAPEATSTGGDIVVTGSRIATPVIDSANPIQVISAETIQNSGNVNIQDTLLRNPVFGTPGISRTNSNFSTSSAGVATVDLRNLGSDRTLVLVNGRRFVAGVPGTATVDLNVIPTQFIQRVDVLTGGSSAVYGSDAVAGVVNIILKDDFQGLELDAKSGVSQYGDDTEREINLTMGGNFDDGRGNIMVYAGYSKQGGVFSRDRKRSAVDQISCLYTTCDIDQTFEATQPYYSSFAPQGRFFAGVDPKTGSPYSFTFAPDGALQSCFTTNGPTCSSSLGTGVGPNGYNRSAVRTIAIPTERYLMALNSHYDISDHITAFLEGTYASTRTRTKLEPFPLDTSGSNGIFPATGGRFNIEGYAVDPTTGASTLVRNPLVPIAIYNAATDTTGDGLKDIGFTKRLSEFGNRGSDADRDTFRIVGGLRGDLSDKWSYEAYYDYGETRESQQTFGQVNVLNFANALNAVQDVYDLNGNGSTTDAICADPTARAQGCVAADVYGLNTLSQGAIDYIIAPSSVTSLTTQSVAGAGVVGSLPGLPAGDIGIALGTEYRRETSKQTFDALTNAGLNGGNKLANTQGHFDVVEGYGELKVPVLADMPGFHQLEFDAAGRVSDYSTVGTVFSYNLSGVWAPVRDIRIRGTYSQSTRAPNIGELFGGAGQTYPTGIVDPCEGVKATDTSELATRCIAAPGVAANMAANGGVFTLNQADQQGISGLNTSNPNLKEEQSHSFTVGVAINPTSIHALRNLQLTVDYFDIKIKHAIVSIPRNYLLQQCYESGVQQYCDLITRRPAAAGANSAGSLEFVNSTSNNSGGLKTTGIDTTLSYTEGLGSLGSMNLHAAYTHVFKGYVVPLPGADRDPFAGEIGASKDRATGTINWMLDSVGATLTGTYIGPAYLDNTFLGIGQHDKDSKYIRVGSKFYLDAQLRFDATEHFEFFVGADNLLNTSPPPIISGLPGDTTGAETDAGTYDAIGRRYYAGARLRF